MTPRWTRLALAAAAAVAALATPAPAKTLRVAVTQDAATLDPHANNSASTYILLAQIYETLTHRNAELRLEPGLALAWEQVEPLRWRFRLRPGVRFHGGEEFGADDVVFSLNRARQPTGNYGIYVDTVERAEAVDPLTVDVVTRSPDAVLPDKLSRVLMMDRGWSEANRAERPQNFRDREETFSSRNANGTGPYRVQRRDLDQRTVLVRNPGWWGGETSVTEYHAVTIASDATRVAALLSGEVDFVLMVPSQDVERIRRDPRLKILEGMENRTAFLGMDQWRDELLYSDVKGRNPFRDIRVRQAVAQALDLETLRRRTLRNQAVPTGAMWTRYVNGWTEEMERRPAFDRDAARRLLAEAGYPSGFETALDCPVGPDDEACQAIVPMLAQIGIRVRLNVIPNAQFIQKLQRRETSLYGLSWGVPTFDALYTLRSIIASRESTGVASWNQGGYANARVDELVRAIERETDPEERRGMIREAHAIHAAEFGHVPLYHQMNAWAMRQGVQVQYRADNLILARDMRVD
jgi:peptide/nickel transport system substrate-binding protein